MSTKQEKLAKLEASRVARKAKVDEINTVAADKRLDNELLLVDIEQENSLTLGVDLGVVWLPTGDMVAVRKPDYVDYDKYIEAINESKPAERPALVDELLKSCVLVPTMQKLDQLCDVCGDVKRASVNIAIHMHDVARATLEGKS